MTETKNAGLSPALVESIAGLSAGCMATLIVHPLDIVKTRMQVHRSITTPTSTTLTTVSVIRRLLTRTDRPIAALYRGLTPNLVGNATSWASFFFFKSIAERGLSALHSRGDGNGNGTTAAAATRNQLTPADFFAASLAAGAMTQVITNPVWVLKTRMLSSDAGAAGAYPSMWAGAAQLLRKEGFLGFYHGLGVGMLAVSHGAVQFAVYDPARRVYFARRRRQREAAGREDDGLHISNEATVVLSTASKLAAGATTYPLQVLRSRLQHYDAEALFGRGISGVVRKLWREEGSRGFYRGMVPGVVRVLPATWVTFLVYENVKYYLPQWV